MRDLHHPVSIKTSPPALGGVIERERLVKALTDLPAAAKWLQAPSGTGKSTLAASYARSRKKALVWYRLDERDNDPVFFYQEFERALSSRLQTAELPKFAADDHGRQLQFARRHTSALMEAIAQPTLFVLDDLQRITSDDMQRALVELVAIAGNESELLFVSESTAPGAFFDAIASRQMGLVNDVDLRFSSDECKALTATLRIAEEQSTSISALTGGHAGALVLACELLRGTDPKSALGVATVERIHLHLLTKLVERMPPSRRELLLRTAYAAHFTRAICETLAGPDVLHELNALVDMGLLRRIGADETERFEAHGLVQIGMRALARLWLGQPAALQLAEQTAATLIANNQSEAAFTLLVEIGSMGPAISVLQQLAERYAAQGNTELLRTALQKVPADQVEMNSWLCFWTGQTILRSDEEEARIWFGRAYSAFENAHDIYGCRLAAASIVTTFALECGDLREFDQWITLHRNARGNTEVAHGDRFETTLLLGLMCAAFHSAAYPAELDAEKVIARMLSLLSVDQPWISADQQVQAARILIDHGHVFCRYQLAHNAIIATRALVDHLNAGALHRGRWFIAAAVAYFGGDDTQTANMYLEAARQVAHQSQSERLAFELGMASVDYSMKGTDLQAAVSELKQLETLAINAAPSQRADYARMMTRLLLLQGRTSEGLRWAEDAMRIAMPAGFSGGYLRAFEMEFAYALAANDRFAEAGEFLLQKDFAPHEARLSVAYCLLFLAGGMTDLALLVKGLKFAREITFINLLDRARVPLAQICNAALVNGIEKDFVLQLIAAKRLIPPPSAGPSWPWPVHVRTLGGFQLQVQGVRYQPQHKAQDKPLELLKLLVTCQALGRPSAEKLWIAERLWPDADTVNARKSLDMTVGRLRKLLSRDESLVAHEGRLQLSAAIVWTDITPLHDALSQARSQRDQRIAGKPIAKTDANASIAAVLDHYNGPYLADEEGPPWLLAGREAIAAAVRQALVNADEMLQGSADHVLTPALERALAADPTSEDLARVLMRAHLRQDRHSEVVRVHRRLREMLSLLLNIAPSKESDYLRDRAYAAEAEKSKLGETPVP